MKSAVFVIVAIGFVLVVLRWTSLTRGKDGSPIDEIVRGSQSAGGDAANGEHTVSPAGYDLSKPNSAAMQKAIAGLTKTQCSIVLDGGTERPFTGEHLKNKKEGVFGCAICDLPLFNSSTKFESGTGWPSFFDPFADGHVAYKDDSTLGMMRTEILCGRCGAHLGHVFNDGPAPTGQRYCTNSASLKFYAPDDVPPPDVDPAEAAEANKPADVQSAYFAGGCFWGVEDRFQQVPGVIEAVSGYQGGTVSNPTYRQVCYKDTGHAESVKVTFDANKVTYAELLAWFFKFHDPTQVNRQGPDVGTQYRSAIFAADDEQFEQAKAFIAAQSKAKRFRGRNIATKVEHYMPFYAAEDYHQDYHKKHGGSCPLPTN